MQPAVSSRENATEMHGRVKAGESPSQATNAEGSFINTEETMTITEKEIREDFRRFIRHEAMRANIKEDELLEILKLKTIEQ